MKLLRLLAARLAELTLACLCLATRGVAVASVSGLALRGGVFAGVGRFSRIVVPQMPSLGAIPLSLRIEQVGPRREVDQTLGTQTAEEDYCRSKECHSAVRSE